MLFTIAVLELLLVQLCRAAPATWLFSSTQSSFTPPEIQTTSGLIRGTRGTIATDVAAYLSIPFALPPIGHLRFAAPQRFNDSKRIVTATAFGADCPGTLDIGQMLPPNEDCLSISVWVPPKSSERLKAVMIWIYGGAFEGGSSAVSMSEGSLLAKKGDVIVVAINYRLSIFGFPGAAVLPDQNLGLLDQRAAIEWTRDNIEAFGGDPNRIVLFGESAGADSVDLYSYVHLQDPIVKGFIGESGAATMCGLVTNASRENFPRVAQKLGCKDPASLVDCVRAKPVKNVVAAAKSLATGYPPKFVPMPDGKVAFEDYPRRMNEGLFIKAPSIIGNNDQEIGNNRQMNDQEFVCPAMNVVTSRRKFNVPAWRYRFYAGTTGGGPHAAQAHSPAGGLVLPLLGTVAQATAIHATEIPYVFGTLGMNGGLPLAVALGPSTPTKEAVSDEFMAVWSAFAKDPVNGPAKLGWPVYDHTGNTLVRIGYGSDTKSSLMRSDAFDDKCANVRCDYGSVQGKFGPLAGLLTGSPLGLVTGQWPDIPPVQPPRVYPNQLAAPQAQPWSTTPTAVTGSPSSWSTSPQNAPARQSPASPWSSNPKSAPAQQAPPPPWSPGPQGVPAEQTNPWAASKPPGPGLQSVT